MAEANDWNRQVIEDFRANAGKVGGRFAGRPILLLHTVGAKTGQARTNPLVYLPVDGGYAVFATHGGAPTSPDWYHNLRKHPDISIEVGTRTMRARARFTEGEERNTIWERQKEANANFADYERRTTRQIPVIVLEPRDDAEGSR